MPGRKRPEVTELFPGLQRRAAEAHERNPDAAAGSPVGDPAPGRGKRAVLRTQEEIEADLRALSDQEREEVLSSSHLVADMEALRDQIKYVDITLVSPNPHQPRKHFDAVKMQELVDSIRTQGVLSPVHVQTLPEGRYQLIAGERRWRAARLAGKTNIPVIIKAVDDAQAIELALLENLQREDLNALDEAATYRRLLQQPHYTQARLAEKIGKNQGYISKILGLLDLPPAVQALLVQPAADEASATYMPRGINDRGEPDERRPLLSTGAAITLGRVTDPAVQLALAERAAAEQLTVRQVEALVRAWKQQDVALVDDEVAEEADGDWTAAPEAGGAAPVTAPPRRSPTVYPASFQRPAPGGPQIRFSDLSVFQLYREVGRITTVDLDRLEDALQTDLAMLAVMRANASAEIMTINDRPVQRAEAAPRDATRSRLRRQP